MINNFFDKVYVITCKDSVDRQNYIRNHFKQNNIKFEFKTSIDKSYFQSDIISSSEKSLLVGHLYCIIDADINGYNKILICEDDIKFIDDVNQKFNEFIHILPYNWDFLHLGNQSWANIWRKQTQINENLYRFFEGVGSHCIAVNKTVYKGCIDMFFDGQMPVDYLYWMLYEKYNSYCPHEFIADSLSKNNHLGINDEKCIFDSLIHHKYFEDNK